MIQFLSILPRLQQMQTLFCKINRKLIHTKKYALVQSNHCSAHNHQERAMHDF